jgi:hypothetical protein
MNTTQTPKIEPVNSGKQVLVRLAVFVAGTIALVLIVKMLVG